ncbi:MAG: sel1 repeat family protein [Oscillospiraceae bacterium]|nr:sel1 repeat family protein [Oscillospiraceae bacterium]
MLPRFFIFIMNVYCGSGQNISGEFIGIPENIEEAIKYFKKATDLGDMFAPYNLARCYQDGIGIPQDDKKATEMFLCAIRRGNDYAGDFFESLPLKKQTSQRTWIWMDGNFPKRNGDISKNTYHGKNTSTIYWPLYSEKWYKENAEFIKKHKEIYRRNLMYKLPELTIAI